MVRTDPKRAKGEGWYTPVWLLTVLSRAQVFDLDACAPAEDSPRVLAHTRIPGGMESEVSLNREWPGYVFLDPQHGVAPIDRWVDKALRSVYWAKPPGPSWPPCPWRHKPTGG